MALYRWASSRQTVELQIHATLLNHFSQLGTPETMRVA
jgi:hypothetical protein